MWRLLWWNWSIFRCCTVAGLNTLDRAASLCIREQLSRSKNWWKHFQKHRILSFFFVGFIGQILRFSCLASTELIRFKFSCLAKLRHKRRGNFGVGYVKGRVTGWYFFWVISFLIIWAVHPLIHSKVCRCGKPTASKCKFLGEAKMNLPSSSNVHQMCWMSSFFAVLPHFRKKKNPKKTHPGVCLNFEQKRNVENVSPRLSSPLLKLCDPKSHSFCPKLISKVGWFHHGGRDGCQASRQSCEARHVGARVWRLFGRRTQSSAPT